MFDLLKAALRQRPNQILVGEIRGVEGSVAFSAMQTGHPVMSTFHAASVEKLIQRLCGDPINIPKTYVDNLNLVIIQSAVKLPGGGTVRRMLSINELVGYDPETEGFSFMAAFVWDPATDTFTFTGKGSSYLLENKIATMLGIPENRRAPGFPHWHGGGRRWYRENRGPDRRSPHGCPGRQKLPLSRSRFRGRRR